VTGKLQFTSANCGFYYLPAIGASAHVYSALISICNGGKLYYRLSTGEGFLCDVFRVFCQRYCCFVSLEILILF
jgi:hypothetical protein